jgi:aldehyde dehydrogenase (NAD+)
MTAGNSSGRPKLRFVDDDEPTRLFIGGSWVPASTGATFSTNNPSTGEVIAQIADATPDDVDAAVVAARTAFEGPWKVLSPSRRQGLMWRFADAVKDNYEELRFLEAVDMGYPVGPKPASGAERATESLRYFAGFATRLGGDTLPNSQRNVFAYSLRKPVGVVAAIIPWNSPVSNTLWKVAPVLATGCTMVLKPAEEASLVSLRIAEIAQEAGIPDGVINVITGNGEVVGPALTNHRGVDKVAFTGSTAVGQEIVRASAGNLKRITLELGGKSPDIVFSDADLDNAVPGACLGVFANSGQACTAGTRIFVERSIYDEFSERAAAFTSALNVGNSLDPSTEIGPVASAAQLARVGSYLDIGLAEGATALAGGHRIEKDGYAEGYFIAPTLFTDVDDDMRVVREEIFGPVACVLPFDDEDEVVRRSNDIDYGLAGGLWTRDIGKAHRVANALDTGTVWVNTYNLFDPAVPFGGQKMSGWGFECGPNAVDAYLHTKAVWVSTT